MGEGGGVAGAVRGSDDRGREKKDSGSRGKKKTFQKWLKIKVKIMGIERCPGGFER